MHNFLQFLSLTMPPPTPYGWFHLMWLFIVATLCVIAVLFGKRISDKTNKIIILTTAIVCLLLEVYKQLVFSYNTETNVWDYQWYAFPFQFCSTPIYIMLVSGLVKKGKFQDCLFTYLGTFSLLAGALVMLMPTTVFVSTIGINIQTMVCHGAMVVIGVYMLASKRAKLSHRTFFHASLVFAILVFIALLLNILIYNLGILKDETFNMFFISPYFECELPVFEIIQKIVQYPIFLLIYLISFIMGAYLIFIICNLIIKLNKNRKTNKIYSKISRKNN